MYKISLDAAFGIFDDVQKLVKDNLLEISIKKARINFEFKESNLIYSQVILGLLQDSLIKEDSLYMTSLNDNIRATCNVDADAIPDDSVFKEYFNLLEELGEHICQCPALEYVVSENFLKIFIDKPNISLNDLKNIKEVFNENFVIELEKQRPYCLFIRDMSSESRKVDTTVTVGSSNVYADYLTSDMIRKI